MASLTYNYPKLYDYALKLIHRNNLRKRYELIAKEIGRNKKVFEPACGTCLVKGYLDKTCKYEGWDLNQKFIDYDIKRGINARIKNIFDFRNYPKSDVILICDLLHHIHPEHKNFLKKALKKSKKIIVVEPCISFKPPNRFLKNLYKLFTKYIGDNDGINDFNQVLAWDFNEERLKNFFSEFGKNKTTKVGCDLITVFDKS